MCKTFQITTIVWLRVTDFMQGWLQHELGSEVRIGDKRVVCLQHLPGVKDAMRMETFDDVERHNATGEKITAGAMSAAMRNYIETGLGIDEKTVLKEYGITRDQMELFVPIETPKVCMTAEGLLRPWTLNITMGREQTAAVQRAIRTAFWLAVENYNHQYELRHPGKRFAAVEMIEAWCADTHTPDTYVEAMRREWQRREKRREQKAHAKDSKNDGAVRIMSMM